MSASRDDFPKSVVDALAKRAAFICSNPDCRTLTVAPSPESDEKFIYIGRASHICAAAEGGPRFDAVMTSDERRSASNGIFLCSNCADMIDKNSGLDFSAVRLRRWKDDHEQWVASNLNKRPPEAASNPVTFHVTSVGQQGGITAGIVNVGRPPRTLNDRFRTQLAQVLPDKSRVVTITSVLGDGEALSYAQQIKEYLVGQGYGVDGVHQVVPARVVGPQEFDPKANRISIGNRL